MWISSRQLMSAYTKPTFERLCAYLLALISRYNMPFVKSRWTFTYSAVTKVRYYHLVISSTNTMRTINARIWDINTCLTKPALNCFQNFVGGFIFLFPYFFDSQIEASTILLHTVWLRLTSIERLMSPECSRHQVLSFAKMLAVWWTNK